MAEAVSLSLFALLSESLGERLQPIQATKVTLVSVSHLLEDLVLTERIPAVLFTGFQESSHWRKETARYRELAGMVHQMSVFAGGNLPKEDDQRQIHVRLSGPDPLRQEWFLLVLTHRFAALLCGRDQQAAVEEEADRTFDTYWSFEPDIIEQTLLLLRGTVARERPDRLADLDDAIRRFPPPPPDAHLLTLFTTQMIDTMVRQNQERIRLERMVAQDSRLRALGQILSGVAHELNNPLQSVLGFAHLLLEDASLRPAVRDDLQLIADSAERARGVVRNLLQLSRPVSDERLQVDIATLIEQTLAFVRSDMEAAKVQLVRDIQPGLPLISVSPLRIQQMLINLLINALQALADNPLPRLLTLTVVGAGSKDVEITVADNGPGIPADLHERVFDPFFTTKPVGKGTGLGLSVVRTIVAEHYGAIQLRSAPGDGTMFVIRLPIGAQKPELPKPVSARTGYGHILLIDDDLQVKALVQRILERAGYTTRSCSSASEALQWLKRERFDALVSDVLMPDMDGIAFYTQVVTYHPHLTQSLIFMTGDASRPVTRQFLQSSGAPFLLKPFAAADLLTLVQRVLPKNPEV